MANEINNQDTMGKSKSGKNLLQFLNYKELSINQKISFLLTVISFNAILMIGLISYFSSKKSLEDAALKHMKSITEIKKNNIEDYFNLVKDQVRVLSQDKMVVNAMSEFSEAFQNSDVSNSTTYTYDDLDNMEASVKNYYNTSFKTPLNTNLGLDATVESYRDDDQKTTFFQYIYIANNPNTDNEKSLLNKSPDGTPYSIVHGKYHNEFREYASKFGFEDIYLINKDAERVVYSVAKKVDFAKKINKYFKETGLSFAFETAKESEVNDFSFMTDMKMHEPSLGKPSIFVSSPVFDENGMAGVLVFQISKEVINNLVNSKRRWVNEGLGETGETYLVGDDFKMRSDNRDIFKSKSKYIESLGFSGELDADVDKIKNLNTNILIKKVETESAKEAISGRSGYKILKNYMGEKVVSAYAPLNIGDVNWGVITEIQTSEVFKPIRKLRTITLVLIVLLLILTKAIGEKFSKTIAERVISIKESINKMAMGVSISKLKDDFSDEIGMTENAVNKLVDRLEEVSEFANAIGKGDFEYNYSASSGDDKIGNSLMEMKKSLEEARIEEQRRMIEDEKRNWSTQGIAKFGEILRSNNDNLEKLSYEIVSNLVNYLKSNQGGLFLVEGEDEKDAHINLLASYAYNRRKFINKRIEIGEGLIGTCVLEKKTIHITEIPDDYINITSGLGEANPNAILIVPLIADDHVLGVIEIATFEKFEAHEIDFVEKLADSIASTITSVRINAKTAKLLSESNEKANTMSQQEEEMRQNLEELKATQEEMNRIKKEEEGKEKARKESEDKLMSKLQEQNDAMKNQAEELQQEKILLDAIMKYLPDYLYFKDKDSKMLKNTYSHAQINGFKNPKEMEGISDFDLHGEEAARAKYEVEQEIIRTGKGVIDVIEHDKSNSGIEKWVSTTKMPLMNAKGECIGTFGISKDITTLKKMELETKLKNEELQAQEEELRQNLEEMQTIQDELSKRNYLMDALLENIPEFIYFKDENSKFIDCSASLYKTFGVEKRDDIIGKSDFDYFDDLHAQPAYDDEQEIIKTGKPMLNKVEKETRKDGSVTYVITSKLPLKDESGKIVGTFGVSKDVTDSKSIEVELAKEKMFLDALMDNLPATIYFKDNESKFMRISKSMLDLFHATDYKEVLGKSDFDFQGKEHAQKAYEDEQKIIKTGKAIFDHVEKEEFEDGRLNWVSTTKLPLKDKDGNTIGTFGISTNVTEMKNCYEKLEQRNEEINKLKMASKQLDELEKTKKEINKHRNSGKK